MKVLRWRCKEKGSELQRLFCLGILTGLLGVHRKQVLAGVVDLLPLFLVLAAGLSLVVSKWDQRVLTTQRVLCMRSEHSTSRRYVLHRHIVEFESSYVNDLFGRLEVIWGCRFRVIQIQVDLNAQRLFPRRD